MGVIDMPPYIAAAEAPHASSHHSARTNQRTTTALRQTPHSDVARAALPTVSDRGRGAAGPDRPRDRRPRGLSPADRVPVAPSLQRLGLRDIRAADQFLGPRAHPAGTLGAGARQGRPQSTGRSGLALYGMVHGQAHRVLPLVLRPLPWIMLARVGHPRRR